MRRTSFSAALVIVIAGLSQANEWSQFRGPDGNASVDGNAPTTWSASKNVAWKTGLPGRGSSSPIVWKNRVFLTAYTGYGVSKDDPGEKQDLRLHVLSIDRETGSILWDQSFGASENTQNFSK